VVIDEVTVKASPFRRQEESPVSLRRIEISEIEKNPGGNRDISKVIQSFPGVGSGVSFRNDVIVRGGGPGENRFYLDGSAGKKTTFIVSARRSYLQFLFSALKLPFLPTYNDFQFKIRTRLNAKNE
jgi:hypothetical protein